MLDYLERVGGRGGGGGGGMLGTWPSMAVFLSCQEVLSEEKNVPPCA